MTGCDFKFTSPEIGEEEIKDQYQLYELIDPVSLGLDIGLVKELLEHPELQKQLQKVKENTQKSFDHCSPLYQEN